MTRSVRRLHRLARKQLTTRAFSVATAVSLIAAPMFTGAAVAVPLAGGDESEVVAPVDEGGDDGSIDVSETLNLSDAALEEVYENIEAPPGSENVEVGVDQLTPVEQARQELALARLGSGAQCQGPDIWAATGIDPNATPEDYDPNKPNPLGGPTGTLFPTSELMYHGYGTDIWSYGHDAPLGLVPNKFAATASHWNYEQYATVEGDFSKTGATKNTVVVMGANSNQNKWFAEAGASYNLDRGLYLWLEDPVTGASSDSVFPLFKGSVGDEREVENGSLSFNADKDKDDKNWTLYNPHLMQNYMQMVTADVDADGIDEIVVYVPGGSGIGDQIKTYRWNQTGNVLNFSNWVVYESVKIGASQHYSNGWNQFSLVAGDFNDDGKDDIALAVSRMGYTNYGIPQELAGDNKGIMFGISNPGAARHTWTWQEESIREHQVSLAVGDLLGNNRDNVIMATSWFQDAGKGDVKSQQSFRVWSYDFGAKKMVQQNVPISDGYQTIDKDVIYPHVRSGLAAYSTGPGLPDNLYYRGYTWRLNDDGQLVHNIGKQLYWDDNQDDVFIGMSGLNATTYKGTDKKWMITYGDVYFEYGVRAADINNDFKDELVVSYVPLDINDDGPIVQPKRDLVFRDYSTVNPGDVLGNFHVIQPLAQWKEEPAKPTRYDNADMYLALPDTDSDTTKLVYKGQSVMYSDPRVLAVMAGAPVHGAFDQSVENGDGYLGGSGTSLSKSSTQANSSLIGGSISVGAFLSIETEVTIPVVAVTVAKAVFETEFTHETSWETEKETSVTYGAGWATGLDDMVAMYSVPVVQYRYDAYYPTDNQGHYRVEDFAQHIPLSPQTKLITAEEFDYIADHCQNIANDDTYRLYPVKGTNMALSNQVNGDLTTYASTEATAKSRFAMNNDANFWANNENGVSGSAVSFSNEGESNQSIEIEESTTKSTTHNESLSFKVGGGPGTFVAGLTAGGGVTHGSASTRSSGIAAEGHIANMPTIAAGLGYDYRWRLMFYNWKPTADQYSAERAALGLPQVSTTYPTVNYIVMRDSSTAQPLAVPTNVNVDSTSSRTETVSWDYPLGKSGVTGFQVLRRLANSTAGYSQVGTVAYNSSNGHYTFTDNNNGQGLAASTAYEYVVRATSNVQPGRSLTGGYEECDAFTGDCVIKAAKGTTLVRHSLINVQAVPAITGKVSGTAKSEAALGLPATVRVNAQPAYTGELPVKWAISSSSYSYDPSQLTQQQFCIPGELNTKSASWPDNVDITAQSVITTQVCVTVNAAKTVRVTFDAQGGGPNYEQWRDVQQRQAMPFVTVPTRASYTFLGYWDTPVTGGKQYYTSTGNAVNGQTADKEGNFTLYARWQGMPYQVSLDMQGGTGGTTLLTANYSNAMPNIKVPTRNGYTFAGYYDATTGGKQYYAATAVNGQYGIGNWDKANNTTLYARWTPNPYQITFDKNGGVGGTNNVSSAFDQAMPTIDIPGKAGSQFVGYFTVPQEQGRYVTDHWEGGTQYYNADGQSLRTNDKAVARTLYAYWQGISYPVTLNKGLELGTEATNATFGLPMLPVTPPVDPTSVNRFLGYFDAAAGGKMYYDHQGKSASDWDKAATNVTLYAQWTEYPMRTITLDCTGCIPGSGTESILKRDTNPMPDPITPPVRNGHTFRGYFDAPTGGDMLFTSMGEYRYNDPSYAGRFDGADHTFYAQWEARNAINLTELGITAQFGAALPALGQIPTRTGYTFAGLASNDDGSIWWDAAGAVVAGLNDLAAAGINWTYNWESQVPTQFTAVWTPNEYQVTLDDNGGSLGSGSVTATFDAALPGNVSVPIHPEDQVFTGYYTAATGGTQYYDMDGNPIATWDISENTALYAQWTPRTFEVPVGYWSGDSYDEWVDLGSVTVTYGEPLPVLPVPYQKDRQFVGFYSFDKFSYGNWRACAARYYDSAGQPLRNWDGLQSDLIGYETRPDASIDSGDLESCQWSAGMRHGEASGWQGYSPAATDLRLYAIFDWIELPVHLDQMGGTGGQAEVTLTLGGEYNSFSDLPTRTGYTLLGYWDQPTGGTKHYYIDHTCGWGEDQDCARPDEDVDVKGYYPASDDDGNYLPPELFAHWQPSTATVTFNKSSGVGGSSSVTATFGEPMPEITVPTNANMQFWGYFTPDGVQYYDGDGKSLRAWDSTEPLTLIGQWGVREPVVFYPVRIKGATTDISPSIYLPGEEIEPIRANTAPAGQLFDKWIITGPDGWAAMPAGAALTNPTLQFVMPKGLVTVTSSYKPAVPPRYQVTVGNGATGAGSYAAGDIVTVSVPVPTGQQFNGWNISGPNGWEAAQLAQANPQVFTMPAGAVSITPAAFIVVKQAQNPPTGLTAVAEQTALGTGGALRGLTSAMEFRVQGSAFDWKSSLEANNLPAGTYEVRFAETSTLYASDSVTLVIEPYKRIVPGTLTVTGHAWVGYGLQAEASGWAAVPATDLAITYQWFRDEEPISGATSNSYVVTADDSGASIKVGVTASAGLLSGYTDQDAMVSVGVASVIPGFATELAQMVDELPADVTTAAGATALHDALVALEALTDEQLNELPNDLAASLEDAVVSAKAVNHATDQIQVDSAVVPWHVAVATAVAKAEHEQALRAAAGAKDILLLSDITLTDTRTGEPWDGTPGEGLEVTLHGVNLTGRQAEQLTLLHLKSNGETEEIQFRLVDGKVVFTATSFSPYALVATPYVLLTGTAQVGKALTATASSTGIGGTTTYQWFRSGSTDVIGTAKTYTLVAADVDKTVTVKATTGNIVVEAASGAVIKGTFTGGALSLSGTAKVGNTLTVAASTFSPTPGGYTYQWYRAGVAISGATAASYTLVGADAGKVISVKVIATKAGYTDAAAKEAKSSTVANGTFAGTVAISGTTSVGKILTAVPSGFAGSPTYTYVWMRNGTAISGATAKTYALKAADRGTAITVKVTATATGYTSLSKTSAATSAIAYGTFSGGTLTLTGTAKVGNTLKVTPSAYSPTPGGYKYQWYRAGVAISGATAASYKLVGLDAGKVVSVKVIATLTGYTNSTAKEAKSATVAKGTFTAGTVTITGTKSVGKILTAAVSGCSPTPTYTYKWMRSGVAISGATKKTYTLTPSDRGKKITVMVTAAATGYTSLSKTSAATTAIAYGTFSGGTATITGTKGTGKILTAKPSGFSPTSGTTYKYQWQANGANISGATASTYKVSATNAAKAITVKITAVHSGYTNKTVTSAKK